MELGASDKINRAYLLDELFILLEVYKNKLKESQNKNIVEITAIRKLLRLIAIINKTKVTKNLLEDPNNTINLYIKNNFYFTNNDQDIPV